MIKLTVSIYVYPSNYGSYELITCIYATLYKEASQACYVNEAETAVIDLLIAVLQVVIWCAGQILLQHLYLTG